MSIGSERLLLIDDAPFDDRDWRTDLGALAQSVRTDWQRYAEQCGVACAARATGPPL